MENPIKMDDLGGTTIFWKHPYSRGRFGTHIDSKVPVFAWGKDLSSKEGTFQIT